jgi:hypothetical protein
VKLEKCVLCPHYRMPREKYAQWWQVEQYCEVRDVNGASKFIVCACTPFGRPPDDWRPEQERPNITAMQERV